MNQASSATKRVWVGAALMALLSASAAFGQLSVTVIGDTYAPTGASADGKVVVGNIIGPYETFRWTSGTGPVALGRATVPVIGTGAGSPNVSSDGTRVSATIITEDLMYATMGLWAESTGWQQLMPPTPPSGGSVDNNIGDAWGLSGDGNTVVGLYWRPGATDGSAHPCSATLAGGPIDLGTPLRSGRANAANYDGTVIGGWTERNDGVWQATVWVNGAITVLGSSDATATVEGVNPAGNIVVGRSYQPGGGGDGATIWRWNGSAWVRQYVGLLPDASPLWGLAWFSGVDADGERIVGATRPQFSPFYEGMIWMPDTGLLKADDWLAALGGVAPFPIAELTGVSEDGKVVLGLAINYVAPPFEKIGVIIRCASNGDATGDGAVDMRDVAALQRGATGAGAGSLPSGAAALDMNCDIDIDSDDVAAFLLVLNGPNP